MNNKKNNNVKNYIKGYNLVLLDEEGKNYPIKFRMSNGEVNEKTYLEYIDLVTTNYASFSELKSLFDTTFDSVDGYVCHGYNEDDSVKKYDLIYDNDLLHKAALKSLKVKLKNVNTSTLKENDPEVIELNKRMFKLINEDSEVREVILGCLPFHLKDLVKQYIKLNEGNLTVKFKEMDEVSKKIKFFLSDYKNFRDTMSAIIATNVYFEQKGLEEVSKEKTNGYSYDENIVPVENDDYYPYLESEDAKEAYLQCGNDASSIVKYLKERVHNLTISDRYVLGINDKLLSDYSDIINTEDTNDDVHIKKM